MRGGSIVKVRKGVWCSVGMTTVQRGVSVSDGADKPPSGATRSGNVDALLLTMRRSMHVNANSG